MKVLTPLISLFFIVNTTLAQDHSENVSGPYESSQDVTAECLMCHEESGDRSLTLKSLELAFEHFYQPNSNQN